MASYIDVDNLNVSDYIEVWECNCSENGKQVVMAVDDLQYLPTADVQEVKHGKWISKATGLCPRIEVWFCSECNFAYRDLSPSKYCPDCGAKMDKE